VLIRPWRRCRRARTSFHGASPGVITPVAERAVVGAERAVELRGRAALREHPGGRVAGSSHPCRGRSGWACGRAFRAGTSSHKPRWPTPIPFFPGHAPRRCGRPPNRFCWRNPRPAGRSGPQDGAAATVVLDIDGDVGMGSDEIHLCPSDPLFHGIDAAAALDRLRPPVPGIVPVGQESRRNPSSLILPSRSLSMPSE